MSQFLVFVNYDLSDMTSFSVKWASNFRRFPKISEVRRFPLGDSLTRLYSLVMYQSIPNLTIPPGKPRGTFLKGRIPHPPGTNKVRNPDPCGRNIVLKPHPGAMSFKDPAQKHKTWDRNYEKQHWNANMFRNIETETYKSQSFLVGGFYGSDSKYLKSFSIHL